MRFLFLIVLLLCNTAFAELKVFQDEYLFSLKEKAGIIAESADKELADKYTILEYGDGVRLVVPRGRDKASEILNERKVVPYKKESDKCLTQPVKGFNCEPNWYVSAAVEPTDDYYQNKLMWGLNGEYGINANMAWDLTVGDPIVVAVVDTGTNFLHPDLSPNIWRNPREIPDNGKDDDGNGFIDDSHGYNATTGVGKPIDDNGHGSHVAGTICAYGDGGGDIVGVSWNCKILTVKFLRSNGGGSLFDAIRGLRYILRIKRQYNLKNVVINNSWGGGGYSRTLDELIGELEKEGLIFVAAAGNNGQNIDNSPYYPSAYQHANVLRIGAIDKKGNAAGFRIGEANQLIYQHPGWESFQLLIRGTDMLPSVELPWPHHMQAEALLSFSPVSLDSSTQRLLRESFQREEESPPLKGETKPE